MSAYFTIFAASSHDRNFDPTPIHLGFSAFSKEMELLSSSSINITIQESQELIERLRKAITTEKRNQAKELI